MSTALASRANPVAPLRQWSDRGFSLIEIVVSIAVIGVLMAALGSFATYTVSVANQESGRQTAVQVAEDAVERVRALKGSELLTGRGPTQVHTQWSTPVAGVDLSRVLSGMVMASDSKVPVPSVAALPTVPQDVTVNGMRFRQYWYVGRCWLPAGSNVCGTIVSSAELFSVVVVVTWSERSCPGAACSFVASTLVSSAPMDPSFSTGAGY